MSEERDITDEELQDRVVYALLGPAARFARHFGIPLTSMRDWLEMSYYHETKRRGMKMKEVAELMQVSMSKVALLSRALKENFLRPEAEAELPRRIEFMLWAQPLTLAKIKQVITDASNDEINAAIKELVDEGRVLRDGDEAVPIYRLKIATDRRVWDGWVARVDGMNNVLRNVADAVFARFFTEEEAAFARTLTFHVRREDLDRLRRFYEDELFALVQELDGACEEDEDAIPLSLSLFWAPHDFMNIHTRNDSEESEE